MEYVLLTVGLLNDRVKPATVCQIIRARTRLCTRKLSFLWRDDWWNLWNRADAYRPFPTFAPFVIDEDSKAEEETLCIEPGISRVARGEEIGF